LAGAPPGKPLPRLATATEEERFWLSHDFDEAMEAGREACQGWRDADELGFGWRRMALERVNEQP
jgi:hypothetical protein